MRLVRLFAFIPAIMLLLCVVGPARGQLAVGTGGGIAASGGGGGGGGAVATPTLVGASNVVSGGASATVNYPAGILDGDVCVGIQSGGVGNPTTGDTFVSNNVTDGTNNEVFWHRYHGGGSEGAGITLASAANATLCMECWRNVDINEDVTNNLWSTTFQNSTTSTNQITANANDALIFLNALAAGGASTISAPAGFTLDTTQAAAVGTNGCAAIHLTGNQAQGGGQGAVSISQSGTQGADTAMIPLEAHNGTASPHGGAYATPTFVGVITARPTIGTVQLAWPGGTTEGAFMIGTVAGAPPNVTTGGFANTNITNGGNNNWFFRRFKTGDLAVTLSGVSTSTAVCAAVYSGLSGNFDMSIPVGNAFLTPGATTTPTSSAFTTTLADLVVLMTGWNAGAVESVSSGAAGFTDRGSLASSASLNGCDIEDLKQGAAGTQAAAHLTLSAGTQATTVIAVGLSPQ